MNTLRAFGPFGQLMIPGMKWYIIYIPSLYTTDDPFLEEIETWLEEQKDDGSIEYWDHDTLSTFAFINEEDAMAFKLRWL